MIPRGGGRVVPDTTERSESTMCFSPTAGGGGNILSGKRQQAPPGAGLWGIFIFFFNTFIFKII